LKQVREKKRQWPGQRLGEGLAKEFGDLLDYARALEFESKPDYEGLRSSFQRLADSQTEEAIDFCGHSSLSSGSSLLIYYTVISASNVTLPLPAAHPPAPPRPAPVSRGQLIYVKLLLNVTIEGYTAQALDSSHWEDSSLVGPEWETKKRPAVVLDVEQLDGDIYWRVKVLPLKRDVGGTFERDNSVIRVSPENMESGLGKRWLWEKIVVFAVPNAETFVCLPDQVSLSLLIQHFIFVFPPFTLITNFEPLCSLYSLQGGGRFLRRSAHRFLNDLIGASTPALSRQMSNLRSTSKPR
jgi:hypothetical protein